MSGNFKKEWCEDWPVHLDWIGWRGGLKKCPKKVVCPKCKKRFKPRVRECADEGCVHIYIPAHKRRIKSKKKK